MDKIHDQLDEVKVGVEKLREDCLAKPRLSDRLIGTHVEPVARTQQEKLEFDELAQELHAKSEEIYEIRKLYEELQTSMHRKDLFLQQISSATEKLKAEHNEKILRLEGENRDLVFSLDKALARIQELENKARASSEEIASLKKLLLIKQEKNSEVQKNASKDLKERDKYILKFEEESRIRENQLKWKTEQFSHLEEAYKKLQVQFQESKSDWQKEESSLVDKISSLQDTLDAQIRVSESLETQLRMSNQGLAREETRRKILEIELSESRSKFDNVFLECQEAKSKIEQLTMKRDEEIAELRVVLRKKEIAANEMKYKIQQLEQENSNLLVSLKDIQEDQVHYYATSSSLKKLRNNFQCLEQLHSICAINLKEKEADWNSQTEKLMGDMNDYLSEIAVKDRSIRKLQKELEDCLCLLEVKSEEVFTLVMVLKSVFYAAYSKLYDTKEKLEMGIMQIEEKSVFLNQQLQLKNTELQNVHAEMKQKSDEVAVLMEQVQSLESLKLKDNLLEEELRMWKVKLDESNDCWVHLEQQLLELKHTHRENMSDALEVVNFELANKTSESEAYKLNLQKSKSEVEILKSKLEENRQANKQAISGLIVTVNDKDAQIGKLQEQISVFQSGILAKSEAAEDLIQEKDKYVRLAEDRECSIKSLQNEIAQLKNNLAEKEAANSALLAAHNILGQQNQGLSSSVKERDQEILELKKEFESLNQEFKDVMVSHAEKEVMLEKAIKTAVREKILEVEENNRVIANLKNEVNSLGKKVEFQEKSLLQSREVAFELEETKKSEVQELISQLEKEKKHSDDLLEELGSYKHALLEDRLKEKIDRENLIAQLEGACGQIGVFCREDVELMRILGKLSHLSDEDSELASDGFNFTAFSPSKKFIQVSSGESERTPLTELN